MNATELIVELVLAGVLTLVVLLTPAVAAGMIPVRLSAELVAGVIAAGFVLGVVIDRCADTILDLWLGLARFRFAVKDRVADQRPAIVDAGASADDVFPEDWMRTRLLMTAPDAVIRTMEQLRIRVRVARNVVVLVPALTTSAAAAVILYRYPIDRSLSLWLPTAQVVTLLITVWLADEYRAFKTPHTTEPLPADKKSREAKFAEWLWISPATVWIVLQFTATLFLAGLMFRRLDNGTRSLLGVVVLLGASLTFLSVRSWFRLIGTFNSLLWDYSRFHATAAIRPSGTGPVKPSE